MPVDLKQLQRNATALHKARAAKRRSSTMAAVRAALPAIRALRAEGVLWRDIAEAFGNQGVVQGKGKKQVPITTTRLTALVRQIERQQQKTSAKERNWAPTKYGQIEKTNALQSRPVSLAVELHPKVENAETNSTPSEDELRRAALDRLRAVLKKD